VLQLKKFLTKKAAVCIAACYRAAGWLLPAIKAAPESKSPFKIKTPIYSILLVKTQKVTLTRCA